VALDAKTAHVRAAESNLGNLFADIMRKHLQSDVAFLNGGSMRSYDTFGPGDFTVRMLMAILPYENIVVKIKQSGKQLTSVLETAVGKYPAQCGRFLQVGLRYFLCPFIVYVYFP